MLVASPFYQLVSEHTELQYALACHKYAVVDCALPGDDGAEQAPAALRHERLLEMQENWEELSGVWQKIPLPEDLFVTIPYLYSAPFTTMIRPSYPSCAPASNRGQLHQRSSGRHLCSRDLRRRRSADRALWHQAPPPPNLFHARLRTHPPQPRLRRRRGRDFHGPRHRPGAGYFGRHPPVF